MRDQIEVKTFFFRRDEFGKNKGNTRSKPFFLKNIKFCESLLRGPNFEYPSLAKTSEITLIFVHSIPEYWILFVFAAHVFCLYVYSVLNNALCVVTECLRPSPTDHLPVFTDIQSSKL